MNDDMKYLWHDVPEGALVWHYWHGEPLLAIAPLPLNVRAAHIRSDKPKRERAVRLERMRPVVNVKAIPLPVRNAAAACAEAYAAYVKARAGYDDTRRAAGDKAWKAFAASAKAQTAYEKTCAASDDAYAAYYKAGAAYDKAWDAFDKACSDHRAEIEGLHALECPHCPWNGKKKTLFPHKEPQP